MKKIIVAIDALTYNENGLEYAIAIAKRSGGMILGVFLHDLSYIYAELPDVFVLVPTQYTNIVDRQKKDADKLELNMKLFNDRCNSENIKHKAHIHEGTDILDFLINESLFADILILDEHMSFTHIDAHRVPGFIIDVLEDAHCPVLVVPVKFYPVENIFLCYDGTRSSIHAIKMFSYLFPEWNSKTTTLVSFNEKASDHLTHSENIKDLLHQHFTNLKIDIEHAQRSGDGAFTYFKEREENALIVMGAYGRSAFSRLLKKSMANTLIRDVRVPIFISHE